MAAVDSGSSLILHICPQSPVEPGQDSAGVSWSHGSDSRSPVAVPPASCLPQWSLRFPVRCSGHLASHVTRDG